MLAQISFTLVNVFQEGLKPFVLYLVEFSSFLKHQSDALLPCSKQRKNHVEVQLPKIKLSFFLYLLLRLQQSIRDKSLFLY